MEYLCIDTDSSLISLLVVCMIVVEYPDVGVDFWIVFVVFPCARRSIRWSQYPPNVMHFIVPPLTEEEKNNQETLHMVTTLVIF